MRSSWKYLLDVRAAQALLSLVYTPSARRYMPATPAVSADFRFEVFFTRTGIHPASSAGQLSLESALRDQCAAAVRLVETGLAAGFAVFACAGAESHPPAGLATLMASSGWGSGVKV